MLPHLIDMRKTINIRELALVLGLSATFLLLALSSVTFHIITLIFVVLGLGEIGGISADIVKICMFFVLMFFVISLIFGCRKATGNVSKSRSTGGDRDQAQGNRKQLKGGPRKDRESSWMTVSKSYAASTTGSQESYRRDTAT